jgi:hypothetical protein
MRPPSFKGLFFAFPVSTLKQDDGGDGREYSLEIRHCITLFYYIGIILLLFLFFIPLFFLFFTSSFF